WALAARPADEAGARGGAPVEIDVVYDGEDLADVAALLGIDRREVVERHTSGVWTVAFGGFAPGFGYLAGVPGLEVPRRTSPRPR
ncbi:allophanate hydrolase, partial [Clavibacter michiganensis]